VLTDNVKAAADDGAVVANIQKKALEYGVLTEALKYMNRQLPPPAPVVAARSSVSFELVRFNTEAPTPTSAPRVIPTQPTAAPSAAMEEAQTVLEEA
jgi:hypothetical protein